MVRVIDLCKQVKDQIDHLLRQQVRHCGQGAAWACSRETFIRRKGFSTT